MKSSLSLWSLFPSEPSDHCATLLLDLSAPLVSLQLHPQLFNLLLDASHPGASWRLISARFVWPGLSRDLGIQARSCLRCQQIKIQTHVHSTVPDIPVPTRRFSNFLIDIMGPLPSNQGFTYHLKMIDRTTCWLEVVLLASNSAES